MASLARDAGFQRIELVPTAGVAALDLTAKKVVWAYGAEGEIVLGNGLLLITSFSTGKVTAIAVR